MPSAARSARRIVATAVGLMVLVCTVVGVLGWRVLSQEEALVHQQARDRLARTAEQLVSKFADRMQQLDAWLSGNAPLANGAPPTSGGAIVVWLSKAGVYVSPFGRLLYYPTVASLPHLEGDVNQAEAVLRQARAQAKHGDIDGALATYESLTRTLGDADLLVRENAMTGGLMKLLIRSDPNRSVYFPVPEEARAESRERAQSALPASRLAILANSSGVPYRLLSQFERAQLLASSGRKEEGHEQARRLVSEITSGRWKLDKESFTFYDSAARTIAALDPPSPVRVAVAEQVDRLWNGWQSFPHGGSRSSRVWNTTPPLITLVDTNPERLVALIADGNSFGSLGLDLSAAENVGASIVDERGHQISGQTSQAPGVEVMRSLSGGGIPWQLKLVGSADDADTIVRARRRYAILAFSVFVLLVAAACYAIARGTLREATAGRLQGDFVSAVSHEFRSPLTALRQLTELLAQGRIQDESRRRLYFDVLLKETSRLHQLVENLLEFGRMDAGRRQYHFEAVDLSALVEDAVHEYQREADANGHRIEFAPHGTRLMVEGDREAIKRVTRNLLENAVKYSPQAVAVWVETAIDARTAVLRVRDEGLGIPLDEQSRIFEKFVRGEAAKSACIQGTGIGLSMVKEIVVAHHGHVDVQSEVGRGSTFVVRLPLSQTGERGDV